MSKHKILKTLEDQDQITLILDTQTKRFCIIAAKKKDFFITQERKYTHMARGVNKVILIGNLGDEPDLRTTGSGTSVVNISMVTNEVRRNIENGSTTEIAEWHRVVMWGKLADIAKQYLHKGSQIYVEGKLRTRSYTDKQNVKRYVTEIVADEMQMLGTKGDSASAMYSTDPMAAQGAQIQAQPRAAAPMYNSQPQHGYQRAPSPYQNNGGYAPQSAGNGVYSAPNPVQSPAQSQNIYGGQQSASTYGSMPMQEPPVMPNNATTVDGNIDDSDLPF